MTAFQSVREESGVIALLLWHAASPPVKDCEWCSQSTAMLAAPLRDAVMLRNSLQTRVVWLLMTADSPPTCPKSGILGHAISQTSRDARDVRAMPVAIICVIISKGREP